MTRTSTPGRDSAETLALQALAWLASDDALFPVFLGATGAGPAGLRARAADPDFLGAVLDFLLAEDERIVAFCAAAGVPTDAPMRARAHLPGGADPHWT